MFNLKEYEKESSVHSNSLLARIGGNYKFWLIALPAVTMLAQAPAVYAHAETITVCSKQCHGERFR